MTRIIGFVLLISASFAAPWAPLFASSQASQPPAEFLRDVLQLLPLHSALPPVADLASGITASPEIRPWEEKYRNMQGSQPILDPGIEESRESTQITWKETTSSVAIPAKSCPLIILGKAVSSQATLSYDKRMVYSTYDVDLEKIYKLARKTPKPKHLKVLLFGGGLQFPSGHLMYTVLAGSGFMSIGKTYIIFLSKPISSIGPFAVGALYLVEGANVYPMFRDRATAAYEAIPVSEFQSKLASALAKNVDQ